MKKTLFLLTAVLLSLPQLSARAETRYEKSSREKREIASKITWFSHEPLIFLLRKGGHPENWPERYERQHAPENIDLMAQVGVGYGRLHFYKGYGLQMEMPEIRRSIQAAKLMHQHKMLVSLYMAGTMFIESFYREVPEAESWEQRDQYNRPVPYLVNTQTFRHFACPNEPAYRDYIKKVIDIGIDSVKADQFFFDNIFLRQEPKSCRCPRCQREFKNFLRRKYPTSEAVFRRFGYPSVDYIKVNEWDDFNRPELMVTVDDPVLQEWFAFRCESLTRQCSDFYDYIKSRNPNISVGFNLKGLYGINRIMENAVYHPLFQGHNDFFCFDVGGMGTRIDPSTGALVSEIRSYKAGRTLDMTCEEGGDGLDLAVYMAFNYQKYVPGFGYHAGPFTNYAERSLSPLAEFFRCWNNRYYRDTKSVADVAVFRTFPSLAYSVWETLVPTVLTEQVLIQHKVPFDIIFDQQIGGIQKYGAVILPGQECLSKENIDRLTEYVRKGGTLVFTGNTADYNEWRESRDVNPLRDLMGMGRGMGMGRRGRRGGGGGGPSESGITVSTLDKGKLVYIPQVVPSVPVHAESEGSWPFPSSQWALPENHEAIFNAIVGNLPQGSSITTGAPLTTVMEILNLEKSRETIVHFVNFDQRKALDPFRVELKNQFKGKVRSVEFFSPEFDQPQKVDFNQQDGRVDFLVPQMNLYSMIVVAYGS